MQKIRHRAQRGLAVLCAAIIPCLGTAAGLQAQTLQARVLAAADGTRGSGSPAAAARTTEPQLVAGRLLDERTRAPISAGAVHLLARDGRKLRTHITDSTGIFRFALKETGEFRLRAEHIGYETSESRNFRVLAGDTLAFDFSLSTSVVLLAPIEVTASARDWLDRYGSARLAPFNERRTFYEKLGTGSFFTRAALREWDGLSLTSLLGTIAGVRADGNGNVIMRGASSGGFRECPPQYYLNGAPFSVEGSIDVMFRLADLEGVEVYRGAAQVPGEFGGSTAGCGVVVLWTRSTH